MPFTILLISLIINLNIFDKLNFLTNLLMIWWRNLKKSAWLSLYHVFEIRIDKMLVWMEFPRTGKYNYFTFDLGINKKCNIQISFNFSCFRLYIYTIILSIDISIIYTPIISIVPFLYNAILFDIISEPCHALFKRNLTLVYSFIFQCLVMFFAT